MTSKALRFLVPGLVVVGGMAAYLGGWATITVEDLPEYVVAGRPDTLTFTVRQHGWEPLRGLKPRVEAVARGREARADAVPGSRPGQYTAVMAVPEPGDWTITIRSGFGKSNLTLRPVPAIATGAEPPRALGAAQRGERLFVAKACVTCHLHRDVRGSGEVAVGPELTGRRLASAYLQRFLADPGIGPARQAGDEGMPNLGLKADEIAALTAFLGAERQALR